MLEREREIKTLETKLKSFKALKDINKYISEAKKEAEKLEKKIKTDKNFKNQDLRQVAVYYMKIAKLYMKVYDIGQSLKK